MSAGAFRKLVHDVEHQVFQDRAERSSAGAACLGHPGDLQDGFVGEAARLDAGALALGADDGFDFRIGRAGIEPRSFTDEAIMRRYMAAMINEGANVVHEKIALRPLDVDVALLYGYGFPRYRGGPMKYADTVGLANVLADIREYALEDPIFWRPSPLLVELVERGENFASLNQSA